MTHTPTVSVILPTYNRAHTLARAMHSVLRQTFSDMELIIVDDGSSDDTKEVVSSFRDPRIRYLCRSGNSGAAAARNAGVVVARGEFIAFQDSDDEWLLDKLERQVTALRGAPKEIGLCVCGLLRWDTLQITYLPERVRVGWRQSDIHDEVLRTNQLLPSGWCVRRQHFEEIGPFDEALPPLEDWEWLVRYSERRRALLLDEPLCVIYESPDSISANHTRYIRALEGIIAKHRNALANRPRGLANLHYMLGKKYALHDSLSQSRRCYVHALRLNPLDLRPLAALLLGLGGQRLFRSVWGRVRHLRGVRVKSV